MYNLIYPYNLDIENLPKEFILGDHLCGFDHTAANSVLDQLDQHAGRQGFMYDLHHDQPSYQTISQKYPNLNLILDTEVFATYSQWPRLKRYRSRLSVDFKNFICSFNGTAHVGRKMLVAILNKFGWANREFVSKNFSFSADELDGHIQDYVGDKERFYRKFFITDGQDDDFFAQIIEFDYSSFASYKSAHYENVHVLDKKLRSSFVHVVAETLPTSYVPFITEKFLYSVVTRGLFLAWAQPNWHQHLIEYHGFRLYDKIFDYSFDAIQNPVERLLALMSMLSKFSHLSCQDWHDLYLMETENIEYNYHHYLDGGHDRLVADWKPSRPSV